MLLQLALAGAGIARLADAIVEKPIAEKQLVEILPQFRSVYADGDPPAMWVLVAHRRLPMRTRLLADHLADELISLHRSAKESIKSCKICTNLGQFFELLALTPNEAPSSLRTDPSERKEMQFLAADTGGTFTDVAVYDQKKGQLRFGKTLTTYGNLIDGVLAGVLEAGGRLEAASSLRHGTTHVINAFLQRRGARTALVATRGFRDVLEIGRGNRPVPFDTSLRREPPLASRNLRFEVTERMGADGIALVQLDEAEIEELVPRLVAAGVQAVAVSFLNSYANPVHEERAASLLRSKLPEIYVTTGTALTREWFEYERSSTATANAYVGPTIATYVDGFTKRLKSDGFSGTLAMMGSNGGVLPFEAAVERPVTLVESGPIGGVIAAAEYAKILELDRVIAFDMGGTTAKCALVESGAFSVQPTYWVGGYAKGFPIRSPVLDIVEVGAGGGSIAWVDAQKRMCVGPRSAGSEPGPACFGRGGIEPTVTDANLVLGRIGGKSFLEGRLPLHSEKAHAAIRDRVATPLGFPDSRRDSRPRGAWHSRYDHVLDGRRCQRK